VSRDVSVIHGLGRHGEDLSEKQREGVRRSEKVSEEE